MIYKYGLPVKWLICFYMALYGVPCILVWLICGIDFEVVFARSVMIEDKLYLSLFPVVENRLIFPPVCSMAASGLNF